MQQYQLIRINTPSSRSSV